MESKLRQLEVKAKELGVSELDTVSNNGSVASHKKSLMGNVSTARDKLVKERRIQEATLISVKKKYTLDLQNKKKELDRLKQAKDGLIESYTAKQRELDARQTELAQLQLI